MKVLFLFEHTGLAAMPFTVLGIETYAVDIQNEGTNPWVTHYIKADILVDEFRLTELAKECLLVFGMPPCTDLTVAGARHFAAKASANPAFQQEAIWLARSVERIGDASNRKWAIENPIGVMSKLWRKPDFMFSPNHYSGYLPEDDVHPLWPKYIAPRDKYTKRTCIWAGNGFKMPKIKPLPYERHEWVNRQTALLGGKSLTTKKIRSASPRGFFTALAQELVNANN